MLDRFNWHRGLSAFIVAIMITAAVVVLLSMLTFAWGFDLETAPSWQVCVHYVMLALLLSLTLVMASYRPLCYGERFRGVMLAMVLAVPAVVFAVLWVAGGAYAGLRDPRIFQAVVISVPTYVIIWGLAVFPYSLYLLGRDLLRVWWQGQPGEGQPAKDFLNRIR